VPSSATSGDGIRETIVRAIRAAASLAEREILARGVEGMPHAQDETELLAQLDGSAQMRAALEPDRELPPFPDEDVASEWVWPSASGRKVLRALARRLATGGVTRLDSDPGSIRLRVGDLCMHTTPARRTLDPAAARAAMIDLAAAHLRGRSPMDPDPTLVLAKGGDDSIWLWTISPWAMQEDA
jgi:hypothetical protein